MTGAEVLTYGKAILWFALPLALGLWELQRLRRLQRRSSEPRR